MNNRDLIKYISAFTMGDGGVYYSGVNCRFVSNQIDKNRDYIDWRADILSNLTEVNLHTVPAHDNKQALTCTTTKTHPYYTKVRKRLYIDSYKSVDPFYLKGLDWEMAAILYQDDGSFYRDPRAPNGNPSIKLNTKRLSYGDSLLLKQAFRDRLDVEFNVNRHYDRWFLTLRARDATKFIDGVKPYVKDSFAYKIG